ncbi:MAG TPA: DUF899 family protein [Chthoniobacteraceae bacterium]
MKEKGTLMKQAMKGLPRIVSRKEWLGERKKLLTKEKKLTHARDELNGERRRLPMVRMDKEYTFEGPGGKAGLRDLFDNCVGGRAVARSTRASACSRYHPGARLARAVGKNRDLQSEKRLEHPLVFLLWQ